MNSDVSLSLVSTTGSHTEHLVLILLFQLIVILAASRIFGWMAKKYFGQTAVSGEILAGIALGPSVMGALFPQFSARVFEPTTAPVFVGLAQLGLVLLMFQIGIEFQFRKTLAKEFRKLLVISSVGIVVPFTLGYVTAPYFWNGHEGVSTDLFGFRLFFALAMSITAIPILGRIFMELGMSHTRIAGLTISAAAIDDVIGWLILSVVVSLVSAAFYFQTFILRLGALVTYLAVVLFLIRKPLHRWITTRLDSDGGLGESTIAVMLLILFASACMTSMIGIFAVFGGFAIGAAVHDITPFVKEWKEKVGRLVFALFLPLFFAYTGLRTDIGSLGDAGAWWQFFLICGIAFIGKFGGVFVACRLTGENLRDSTLIGICMNTRALMELIVLNIGYDIGVLSRSLFTMFVLMALVSTFITTPIVRRLINFREESIVRDLGAERSVGG